MFLPLSKIVFNCKVPIKELTKKALKVSEWELSFIIRKLSGGPPHFRCPLLDQSTGAMSWALTTKIMDTYSGIDTHVEMTRGGYKAISRRRGKY